MGSGNKKIWLFGGHSDYGLIVLALPLWITPRLWHGSTVNKSMHPLCGLDINHQFILAFRYNETWQCDIQFVQRRDWNWGWTAKQPNTSCYHRGRWWVFLLILHEERKPPPSLSCTWIIEQKHHQATWWLISNLVSLWSKNRDKEACIARGLKEPAHLCPC